MRLLFLGDVMGRPGREALRRELPVLRRKWSPDFVAANAENASGGVGLAPPEARELLGLGVDCLTGGNHTFRFRELRDLLDRDARILRPANLPPMVPGKGMTLLPAATGGQVAVLNLLGRVFMDPADCPFRAADALLASLEAARPADLRAILVDFHAEATSEKQAMAWHLDGRVDAVIGTHTHVQTSDARILPGGTAALCDAGMCGVADSILGMAPKQALGRFLDGLPARFELAKGAGVVQGVVVDVDETPGKSRGRATAIHLV